MGIFDHLLSALKKPTPTVPEAPVAAPEPPPDKPVERRRRKRVNARNGTRALIIDDSATIIAALRKMLRSAGLVVSEALDAEKGIEIARAEKPDLIFLDIVLPGMNGFAALRQMRRDAATHDIPIIMMSGNEQATEQFYASRIGADDFIKKPFTRQEVFSRIEALLDAEQVPRRKAAAAAPATAAVAPAAVAPAAVAPAAVAPAAVAPAAVAPAAVAPAAVAPAAVAPAAVAPAAVAPVAVTSAAVASATGPQVTAAPPAQPSAAQTAA